MGKQSFWMFIDDASFNSEVKKHLVQRFVMNYLRMEHASVPRSIRRDLVDELEDGDPSDMLRTLGTLPSSGQNEAKKKMLRSIIKAFGAN